MKNGDQFAFPYAAQDPELLGEGVNMGGMTKRETFSLYAPPAPDWFSYESKLTEPKQPKSWIDMEDGPDKIECKNWQYDPCYDLPDHLKWYQEAWEDYKRQRHAHVIRLKSEFYFAWRLYFADELLKQLES